MARLHEHQGKALLAGAGIAVPQGEVASSPREAAEIARRLGGRVVLKAQAFITGRAAAGAIQFANTPQEAERAAAKLLALRLGQFPVTEVLVEKAIEIRSELFVSLAVDDEARAPVLLLDAGGGSGIEERSASVTRLGCDPRHGVPREALTAALAASKLEPSWRVEIAAAIDKAFDLARRCEARSLEINPLAITAEGRVIALDCRITIDDYAVFRHPELGIEVARELDHPATALERSAWKVEQADHRGTFFFAQLGAAFAGSKPAGSASRGLIGFHGAGGGGSMMSMDAITRLGFRPANYCDTSGNPSAGKVYRAARIILAQPGLVGYFGSGSGVASQEQWHSAYGLAKAFCELELSIPAVIRLGGNGEERAVEILRDACRALPAKVEGYAKDDTPAAIAQRLVELVDAARGAQWTPRPRTLPAFVGRSYQFPIKDGTVWIDQDRCDAAATKLIIERSGGLLRESGGKPTLAVKPEEIADKDSELVALEVECRRAGKLLVYVDLPVPGLDSA